MADEITITMALSFSKGSYSESIDIFQFTADMTGDGYIKQSGSVGATDAALPLGNLITTPGWCLFKNTHASQTITIRPADDGTDLIIVPAGEAVLFKFDPTDATAPFLMGSGADTTYEYLLIEA